MSDSVSPSPKGGGAARPPLNPPLRRTYYISGSAESEYYSIADNERCILNRDGEKGSNALFVIR